MDEPQHDWGLVVRGADLHHDFEVRNEGGGVLHLLSVQPSCGCTVVNFDREFPPGGNGKIEVRLDTGDLDGRITKSITVVSNDPESPRLVLQISADVFPLLEIAPRDEVELRSVLGVPEKTTLSLRVNPDRDARIVSATTSLPFVSAVLHAVEPYTDSKGRMGRQYRLDLVLGQDAPLGPGRGMVHLVTDDLVLRQADLKLWIDVDGPIYCSPGSVYFGTVPRSGSRHVGREVIIATRNSNLIFHILGATSDSDYVVADVVTVKEGQRYSLALTWKGDAAPGMRRGTITVRTDSALFPSATIPFSAFVPE